MKKASTSVKRIKKHKYENFIGIDNGATGSIGIIKKNNDTLYLPMPAAEEIDFHKDQERMVTRVNHPILEMILSNFSGTKTIVLVERPMYNAKRFYQSISAARAYESVLILLDKFELHKKIIDSTEWQNMFFPKNRKRRESGMTKALSNIYGKKYFPDLDIGENDDYDGILIAKYAQITYGG